MKQILASFTALALLLGLCACSKKVEEPTWQEQFDLGVRYLSEGNYEEAILTFTAAIEIDPMQAETYEKLADAYLALGNLDSALQTLRDGFAATGDTRLQARIDELAAPEFKPTPESTAEPTPESAPTPTVESTLMPTLEFSSTPTQEPTPAPSTATAAQPIVEPTAQPTVAPTSAPTPTPTQIPAPTSPPVISRETDFEIENGELKRYNGSGGAVTIPEGVTSIAHDVFNGCDKLTSIVIPSSVTNIGTYAFAACDSLTSINLPIGLTEISFGLVLNCSNLTNAVIPNGVTNIGVYSFSGCSKLSEIVIPSSVVNIEYCAFRDCTSLTSVIIPSSVTSIGWCAFDGCRNLSSVYYSGTQEQWEAIDREGSYPELDSAAIHFNS